MKNRDKLTAYLTPELADAVRRVSAFKDRTISDIIEDALGRAFSEAGRDAEQAAIMAKLDVIRRRISAIERGQETLFELTAQAARIAMSVTPEIPEADRAIFNARGNERLQRLLSAIAGRLAAGRGVWREGFFEPAPVEAGPPKRAAE